MPLIIVTTSGAVANKDDIAKAIAQTIKKEINVAAAHVHVLISDDQFLSFGGNSDTPAATVTIKAADNSISKDGHDRRKAIVSGLSALLTQHIPGLPSERIYMTFEDLPVQNIAVGDEIMTFSTMRTAKSAENVSEIAP